MSHQIRTTAAALLVRRIQEPEAFRGGAFRYNVLTYLVDLRLELDPSTLFEVPQAHGSQLSLLVLEKYLLLPFC